MSRKKSLSLENTTVTIDTLLDGKVKITQPKEGYRTSLDSVFLAAFVHPQKGSTVLDVGAGCGSVSLLLPFFFPNKSLSILAVEHDPFLCSLIQKNAQDNELQENIQALCKNIFSPSSKLDIPSNHFDCVVTNPPFYDETHTSNSPRRAQALHTSLPYFEKWIETCIRFLKQGGTFTIILPPARLEDFLNATKGKMGALRLFPLWPKDGENAHRILIQGIKGRKTPLTLEPGLIIHTQENTYTLKAQNVLKEGHPF